MNYSAPAQPPSAGLHQTEVVKQPGQTQQQLENFLALEFDINPPSTRKPELGTVTLSPQQKAIVDYCQRRGGGPEAARHF